MNFLLLALAAAVGALLGGVLAALLRRAPDVGAVLRTELERVERAVRDEAEQTRREVAEQTRGQRAELGSALTQAGQLQQAQHDGLRTALAERLDGFAAELRAQNQRLADTQRQLAEDAHKSRSEQAETLNRFGEAQRQLLSQLGSTLDENLKTLRSDNAEKLEQMRRTVDEKLHETLEKRLGDSFKLVSERLELVHKGLGEMQTLAAGVGDLKRVLTNVKTRGGWGEVQLESILEQIFTAEQFARSVKVNPASAEMVDAAIRLPGRGDADTPVWLPIDAKFPREDYERLIDAQERADVDAIKTAGAQLQRAVEIQAKSISEKYLHPPHTTDFGVMFLPTEGLYAEVIRRPGLIDDLQRKHRIVVAGPTTLTALLNSLQLGFRTLAIEKRSSEVWKVLGAVKTEFGKFGDVLDKVKKKLDEASTQIEATGVRSRAISRQLREVEALPGAEVDKLLPGAADADE